MLEPTSFSSSAIFSPCSCLLPLSINFFIDLIFALLIVVCDFSLSSLLIKYLLSSFLTNLYSCSFSLNLTSLYCHAILLSLLCTSLVTCSNLSIDGYFVTILALVAVIDLFSYKNLSVNLISTSNFFMKLLNLFLYLSVSLSGVYKDSLIPKAYYFLRETLVCFP